jgi:hypothetical protein
MIQYGYEKFFKFKIQHNVDTLTKSDKNTNLDGKHVKKEHRSFLINI